MRRRHGHGPASVPAEVRRLCELDPHVVKLLNISWTRQGQLLLVQEYLSGGTVGACGREKRLTQDETAQAAGA